MACNRIYQTELDLNEIKQEYEYVHNLGWDHHLIKDSYFYYIYVNAMMGSEGMKTLEQLSWMTEEQVLKKYKEI